MPKIVLITGATSGIGEACAHQFAKEGYHLILTGRRTEKLESLSAELKKRYLVQTITLVFDVRDSAKVSTSLSGIPEEWKNVDVCINNAGVSQGLEPIDKGDFADWDMMIDTNVKGFLYVAKIVSGWMILQNKGHIVNLGSVAGKEVYANGNVYCATKFAVDALSKAMRIDLLPYKIKVTAINPGAVETDFSNIRFKGDTKRAKKVYEGYEPLVAQDIAETIWFVVSRPAHVNINDLVIMPTAQANATTLLREL